MFVRPHGPSLSEGRGGSRGDGLFQREGRASPSGIGVGGELALVLNTSPHRLPVGTSRVGFSHAITQVVPAPG